MLLIRLTGGQEFTYIDVYEQGKFVSETELIMNGSSISMLETAPVVRVRVHCQTINYGSLFQ